MTACFPFFLLQFFLKHKTKVFWEGCFLKIFLKTFSNATRGHTEKSSRFHKLTNPQTYKATKQHSFLQSRERRSSLFSRQLLRERGTEVLDSREGILKPRFLLRLVHPGRSVGIDPHEDLAEVNALLIIVLAVCPLRQPAP